MKEYCITNDSVELTPSTPSSFFAISAFNSYVGRAMRQGGQLPKLEVRKNNVVLMEYRALNWHKAIKKDVRTGREELIMICEIEKEL